MENKNAKGWLYLLPAFLFLGVFMVYPLLDVLIYSFEEGYNFASQTYLQENGDIIAGFCRALHKAMTWIETHTDEEVAQVMLPQFPDTDLAVLTAVTARHRAIDAWNTGLTMEQVSLERLETVMTQAGELEKAQWVDFGALVDNSWAAAAAK